MAPIPEHALLKKPGEPAHFANKQPWPAAIVQSYRWVKLSLTDVVEDSSVVVTLNTLFPICDSHYNYFIIRWSTRIGKKCHSHTQIDGE